MIAINNKLIKVWEVIYLFVFAFRKINKFMNIMKKVRRRFG